MDRKLFRLVCSETLLMDWVRNSLGVDELNLNNICTQLVTILSGDIANLSETKLIKVTQFIRDHYDEISLEVKAAIKTQLPLLLADGSIILPKNLLKTKILVVPGSFDPVYGWTAMFSDPDDRNHMIIISDKYLENKSVESKKEWGIFFKELGVYISPPLKNAQWKFGYYPIPDDIPSNQQEFIKGSRAYSTDGYWFYDWVAPKWLKNLAADPDNIPSKKQYKALIRWLERQDLSSPSWKTSHISWFYYNRQSKNNVSEFYYLLQNAKWFPTTNGFQRPSEVFINKPAIREFFGNTLNYSLLKLDEHVEKFLNLRTEATANQFLGLLGDLALQPAKTINPKLVNKIYSFISDRVDKDIRAEFEKNAWILSTKPIPEWVNIKKAIWHDLPLGFEGTAYTDISSQYDQKLQTFFVKQLGVADNLDDESFGQALINLNQLSSPQAIPVETALEKIFPVLLKIAKSPNKPGWWENTISNARIWTKGDKFYPPSEVFIPDDGELQKKMAQVGIQFAWRPYKETFADYMLLYQDFGVQSLVDNVVITPKHGKIETQNGEYCFLTNGAKIVICFYLRNEAGIDSRKTYETLKTDGKIEALLRTREVQVPTLNTIFELNGKSASDPDAPAFWDRDNHTLFISNHSLDELETEIPSLIARRLVNMQLAKSLENFIGGILGCSTEKSNRIIDKHNWNMPEEELAWINMVLGTPIPEEPKPEEPKPDGPKPDGPKPDGLKPDGPKPDGLKPDGLKPDGPKPDGPPRKKPVRRLIRKPKPRLGNPKIPRPRMVSYLENADGDSDPGTDGGTSERSKEIGDAGVNKIIEYEKSHGRNPTFLGQTHEGWDIDSEGKADGIEAILGNKNIRRIEVKSKEGLWDGWGVGLTFSEFKAAQQLGDDYYLYVIENVLDPDDHTPPYIFKNPAALVTDYRFDDHWKKFSICEDSIPGGESHQPDDSGI